jgi:transposase
VGIEACLSAHFVSRTRRRLGHTPRIIPAIYVKPFAKGQKNDYNDAEAIAEAVLWPNLRVVQRPLHAPIRPPVVRLARQHRPRPVLVRHPFSAANQGELIYLRTGNLRAVQLLLGHTKVEGTVRYLGIEVDEALAIAEQIDV